MKQFRRYLNILAMLLLSVNLIGQDYCTPSFSNGAYSTSYYIESVVFDGGYTKQSGLDNESSYYNDYTSELAGTYDLGGSGSVTLTSGDQSYGDDTYFRVWIDFNKDGDFDDAGEEVANGGVDNDATSTTLNFDIPTDASFGDTRMRIIANEASNLYDPCYSSGATNQEGEAEDYRINIAPPVLASFSLADTNVVTGDTIYPINNSTDADSYKWSVDSSNYDFAGSSDTSHSPGFVFTKAGDYTITLIAYQDTVSDTTSLNIHVFDASVAKFSASSTGIALDDTVTFTNTSENADSFVWSVDNQDHTFIDSDLNDQNPSIQFTAVGTYEVTLTTYNTVGTDDSTIVIKVFEAPTALFTSDKTVYNFDDTASFTDQTLNGADSWSWTFDPSTVEFVNGTDASSQNPEVAFLATGSYNVELIASNVAGADTLLKESYLSVLQLPEADFTFSDSVIFEGDTVTFTNASSNETSYTWTFSPSVTYADGFDKNSENPSVIFSQAGQYTVFLTVANDDGQDVKLISNAITVYEKVKPVADFTVDNDNPIVDNDTVTFVDNSENIPNEWFWSISPSTYTIVAGADNESSISVVFTDTGYYDITLMSTNDEGFDFEEKEQFVYVQDIPVPTAEFSATDSTPVVGQVISLNDLSTQNPTSWIWSISPASYEFVGNSNQNTQHPEIKFTAAASYSITLIVDNGYTNALEIKEDFIVVTEPQLPVAEFSSETAVLTNENVEFSDASSHVPTQWQWSFEPSTVTFQEGTDAGDQNPVVAFNQEGVYTVTLIVSNLAGSDTIVKQDYITATEPTPPTAAFSANTTTVEIGDVVTFTDASSGDPTVWSWSFDPNTTSYENGTGTNTQNPQVSFNAAGTYSVTLTVTNTFGSDQEVKDNYITVTEPVGDTTCKVIYAYGIEDEYIDSDMDTTGFVLTGGDLDGNALGGDFAGAQSPGLYAITEDGSQGALHFFSAWEDASAGPADDWFIFGPITLEDQGGYLTWLYDFSDYTKRNGYKVVVNTVGYSIDDFNNNGTVVYSSEDNDASTQNHPENTWVSANADLNEFAGQKVYIAFQHISDNQEMLVIDEIKVMGCSEDSGDGNTGEEGEAPVANFTASTTSAYVNATINFNDVSTNNPTSWDWDFGTSNITFASGTNATSQNPKVQFNAAGTYTVILTATNSYGTDVEIKSSYITITEDNTDNGGGNGTDDCNTFAFDWMNITIEGDIDTTGFGLYIEDNDENAIGEPYSGYGFETSGFYYTSEAQDDVVLYLFSNWENSNAGPADDWVTFGPVEVPTNGTISFDYDFANYAKRNGFDVYVGTNGPGAENFTDATLVWSTQDNDEGTANNVQDQFTKAVADISAFAGQKVFFAFHHNANNQDLLVIDNIEISSCGGEPTDDGKIDGDDNTDNGGGDNGGDNNGGTSDTTCSTLLDFYLLNADVNESDEANFGISLEDGDGQTWNAAVFGADRTGSWGTGYVVEGADTNWNLYTTSYWESGEASADDWFTFGPITIPSEGATISWTHKFYADNGRNAYAVKLGTSGLASSDFSNGETLYSVAENDASTAGDTLQTTQTASISDTYAGQQIYIAFHHTGTNMFVLEIDDIVIEGCSADDNNTDNGDGDGDGDGDDELSASFTASATNITVGETIDFTSTSTGNIVAYMWQVSGGDFAYVNGTSNEDQNVSIQFNEEGTYSVYVMVADGVNSPATSATTTITVTSDDNNGGGDNNGDGDGDVNLPVAGFVASATTGTPSDEITLTSTSQYVDGASYNWTISPSSYTIVSGDLTSSELVVTLDAGVYDVTLEVITSQGQDEVTRSNYILIGEPIAGLWSSDFSDASHWNISSGWVIGTDAPAGGYSSGMGTIASTTANNGFALYDADAIDNGQGAGSSGSLTMANPVNLSGVNNAAISLEYYFRSFYDTLMIEYSTDNSNWEILSVFTDGMAPNELTDNPAVKTISASNLDGQSQVWFRITYQGPSYGYAGMVDDFAIIEQPENDLKGLTSMLDYVSTTYAGAVPLSQVEGIRFAAGVLNNGSLTQTGVKLNAEVSDENGSVVFTSSSQTKSVSAGVIDTFAADDNFIPVSTGFYEASYFFSQNEEDANPTNNRANNVGFAVTDTVFARALYQSTFFGANVAGGDTVQIGANYNLVNTAEISSASTLVAWYTAEGTVIRMNLYNWNTQTGERTLVTKTRDYTVPSIAEGQYDKVTLAFENPQEIAAGNYTVSVEVVSYANEGDDFVVSMDHVSPIYTPMASCILARSGGGNHAWYNLSTTPHVYLNIVDPNADDNDDDDGVVVGIENINDQASMNVYPNPNSGQFEISLFNVNDENAYLEVISPMGQLVKSIDLRDQLANVPVDLRGLTVGIYYIKLVSPSTNSVQISKVIIQ